MCKTPGTDHNINATHENMMGTLQHGKNEWLEQLMVTDSSESVSKYLDSGWLQLPPKLPDVHPAIIDTGTTGHFLCISVPSKDVRPAITPIKLSHANRSHNDFNICSAAWHTTVWTTTSGYSHTLVPGTDRVLTHFCCTVTIDMWQYSQQRMYESQRMEAPF